MLPQPFYFESINHGHWGSTTLFQDIISRLHADGYPIHDFLPDGKFHRFSLDDKDHRKSGFYLGYQNFVQTTGEPYFFVIYGSWRDGLDNAKRFSTLTGGLSAAETKLQQEQIRKAQREAEKFKNEAQMIAAEEAKKKWDSLADTGESEYLKRKQIETVDLGVRFDNFYGDIYVPARDEQGRLWSFECVKRDGAKLSHPGGRKTGCFHIIGSGNKTYFAEGLATAASLHLATGERVVCTFGSSGLKRVATIFRKMYPDGQFVICGDRDKPGSDTSRVAAEQAGEAVACPVVFPTFTTGTGKDFNDLHVQEGLEKVSEQLHQISLVAIEREYSPTEGIYPDEDDKGKRTGTLRNVKELLRRLKITVRYNVISKSEEINIPGLTTTIDNRANVNLTFISDWCKRVKVPTDDINSHINSLADQNLYNPVASWIESEPWDGVSRLQDFFDTIESQNKKLKEVLIRKWMLSAVAALYEPDGVYAGGVLVLQGKQYSGKTKWFKNLVPHDTGLSVLAEGVTLRPDDKDSVYQVISNWIVELGELDATFRKADIAQLKSFLTKTKDVIRRPYARAESHYARRTVFFASVNEKNFLNDPTGNRRFWTIECDKIDFNHCINMQQLWAELRELYLAKADYILSDAENAALNDHNEQFEALDPIEETVQTFYDWNDPRRTELTLTQICKQMGIQNPSQKDLKAAAKAVVRISATPMRKTQGKRLYAVPPAIVASPDLYSKR